MVALYAFAYHVVHQAADVYYDGQVGVATFARSFGAPRTVALAAWLSAAAAGLGAAAGYYLAALALVVVTAHYATLYRRVVDTSVERQSTVIAARFDIGVVASVLNLAMAVSVLFDVGAVAVPV